MSSFSQKLVNGRLTFQNYVKGRLSFQIGKIKEHVRLSFQFSSDGFGKIKGPLLYSFLVNLYKTTGVHIVKVYFIYLLST